MAWITFTKIKSSWSVLVPEVRRDVPLCTLLMVSSQGLGPQWLWRGKNTQKVSSINWKNDSFSSGWKGVAYFQTILVLFCWFLWRCLGKPMTIFVEHLVSLFLCTLGLGSCCMLQRCPSDVFVSGTAYGLWKVPKSTSFERSLNSSKLSKAWTRCSLRTTLWGATTWRCSVM